MFNLLVSLIELPLTLVASIAAIFAFCGCMACMNFRCRDCGCIKSFLRCVGVDKFDDFELMVLVHEVSYQAQQKTQTAVKVTAGHYSQKTEWDSKGIFQQPLRLFVEQGTSVVRVDLLNSGQRVIATVSFKVTKDLLEKQKTLQPETVYGMKTKGKGVQNPRVKLTLVIGKAGDLEQGLLAGGNPDVDYLVNQKLQNIRGSGSANTELEVLRRACFGPADMFDGWGTTQAVFIAVTGPPQTRRWTLGLWHTAREMEKNEKPFKEVDVLRIQCVAADPQRKNVFVVNYFDDGRTHHKLTFKATQQSRDVWKDLLEKLLVKLHEMRNERKDKRNKKLGM